MTTLMLNRSRALPVAMAAALTGCLLLAVPGCGNRPRPETAADIPGYRDMLEDVGHVDTAPLRGRLILLDPGHGGFFRGARGPNGLEEADVNLGVSLYLRGLLEWAGARVVMTRTSDRDFRTHADSTLASDLAFRVSMMDSLQPDVFISLHHNSNPSYDPVINETQTYYPLGDSGPSLQLARAIHRHLAFNLGITPARILPGNFHVLRNATVPAVLGEPAMISNPVIAGRLSLAASQKLEAESYFLGLLDYFSQGAPDWDTTLADTLVLPDQSEQPALSWTFVPDHRGGVPDSLGLGLPGGDPATFRVTFNGEPQSFALDRGGRNVSWYPPGSSAEGVVTISGRNLAGNSTPARSTRLVPAVCAAPEVFILREAAADSAHSLVGWAFPSPVAPASVHGRLTWTGGFSLSIANQTRGGRLVDPDSLPALAEQAVWSVDADATTRPCTVTEAVLPAGWRLATVTGYPGLPDNDLPLRQWRYRGSPPPPLPAGIQLPNGFAVVPGTDAWMESDGILPVRVGSGAEQTVHPSLQVDLVEPALWGRTIILDPRGGGTETDGTGPLGTRGADLNFAVARFAADMLTGAGARVVMTRAQGQTPTDPAKVLLARETGADLFLVVGRGADDTTSLRHYPGSTTGSAWARTTAGFLLQSFGAPDSCRVGPGSDYLLRHTHCPALVVELPGIAKTGSELAQGEPFNQRCEAAALVLAVTGVLSDEASAYPATTLPQVMDGLGSALTDFDFALWDGNLPATTPDTAAAPGPAGGESVVSYRLLLPAREGRHQLELHAAGRWQVWSLLREGTSWQGRVVQAGP